MNIFEQIIRDHVKKLNDYNSTTCLKYEQVEELKRIFGDSIYVKTTEDGFYEVIKKKVDGPYSEALNKALEIIPFFPRKSDK